MRVWCCFKHPVSLHYHSTLCLGHFPPCSFMLEKFQGPYGVFAGKDATRYFAKQIVSLDEDDGQPLTSEEPVGMCF